MMRIPARLLGLPYRQHISQRTVMEQLHTAQLHQLGVTVTPTIAFTRYLAAKDLSDLVQVGSGRVQPVTLEKLILGHPSRSYASALNMLRADRATIQQADDSRGEPHEVNQAGNYLTAVGDFWWPPVGKQLA